MDADAKPERRRQLTMDDPVRLRLEQNRVAGQAFRERNAMKMKKLAAKVDELTAALEALRNPVLEAEVLQLRKLVFNTAPVETGSALLDKSPAFATFLAAATRIAAPDFMSMFNLFETSLSVSTVLVSLNTPQSALSVTPTGVSTAFVQDYYLFDDTMLSTFFPASPISAVGGVYLEDIEYTQESRRYPLVNKKMQLMEDT
ncbi:hypothetical protein HDU83_003533 [Entophlyctis luteolus]|nr:hypothetical protein HDU83_003533 [Entophlyctis luteolus]